MSSASSVPTIEVTESMIEEGAIVLARFELGSAQSPHLLRMAEMVLRTGLGASAEVQPDRAEPKWAESRSEIVA
jgi:hypothetical protein